MKRRHPSAPGKTSNRYSIQEGTIDDQIFQHWELPRRASNTSLCAFARSGLGIALAAIIACGGSYAHASIIEMGDAKTFGVLAASTVTNTGPTTVAGDVGVAPLTAITGFPPGTVTFGSLHSNTPLANSAQADALIAYNQLDGLAPTMDLTGLDLGGLVLTPGVYNFDTSAFLTGTLTLDGQGQTNPLFVFQMGSTLITASDSMVNLINGTFDTSNDVFWQVGTSATLGTGTDFIGTIIADQSATLTTDATLQGRVIALNAAVTLDSNTIYNGRAVPSPGALGLLAMAALVGSRRRRKSSVSRVCER